LYVTGAISYQPPPSAGFIPLRRHIDFFYLQLSFFYFVQREQAQEKSLLRFLEKRPRPMGVVHNVTLKR
jgi:hypothetical protein